MICDEQWRLIWFLIFPMESVCIFFSAYDMYSCIQARYAIITTGNGSRSSSESEDERIEMEVEEVEARTLTNRVSLDTLRGM